MLERLLKALRLVEMADLVAANRYWAKTFLPQLNRRLTLAPASAADVHRPALRDLDGVLSCEEPRVVQRDWTVSWQRR